MVQILRHDHHQRIQFATVDGIEELADFLHPATDQALAEREATGAPTRAAINDALVRQD